MTSPRAPRSSAGGCDYGGAAMSDAQSVTLALRGKWYGRYGVAFCPVHDNRRTPALRLANGNDGRLLALCSAGCTFELVVGVLRGMGLLERGVTMPCPTPSSSSAGGRTSVRRPRSAGGRRWRSGRRRLPSAARSPSATCGTGRSLPTCPRPCASTGPAGTPQGNGCPLSWRWSRRRARQSRSACTASTSPSPGARPSVDPVKASLGPVGGGAVRLTVGRIGTVGRGQRRASGRSGRRGRGHRDGPEPAGRPPWVIAKHPVRPSAPAA